ncbi:hypothetical protein [Paraburkholderia terrae]|uniref:hypothetical protein n=1 Tax=Paraburkholderia terrae TaxID=311230 RepID=UPI00336571A0
MQSAHGALDLLAQATWGYGVFQLPLLIRLLPWIMKQPFAPSYQAFTFGLTALSGDAIQMTLRGVTGTIADMSPVLFVVTNVALVAIIVGTGVRAWQGKLLPVQVSQTTKPAV